MRLCFVLYLSKRKLQIVSDTSTHEKFTESPSPDLPGLPTTSHATEPTTSYATEPPPILYGKNSCRVSRVRLTEKHNFYVLCLDYDVMIKALLVKLRRPRVKWSFLLFFTPRLASHFPSTNIPSITFILTFLSFKLLNFQTGLAGVHGRIVLQHVGMQLGKEPEYV